MKIFIDHKRVTALLFLIMLALSGCAKKHVVESAEALPVPDEVVIYQGSRTTVYYIKDSEPFQRIVQAIRMDSIDEVFESAVEEGDPVAGRTDSALTVDYKYKSTHYFGERAFTVLRFCMDGMYENEVLVGSEKGFTSGTYGFSFDRESILHIAQVDEETKRVTGSLREYEELSDGTYLCEGQVYKYRLEITGRMNNAAKDSTFVYLSNIEEISFDRAWKAAGLSSSLDDYFSKEEAVLVEWR